jgi:hypothetical protein
MTIKNKALIIGGALLVIGIGAAGGLYAYDEGTRVYTEQI